MSFSIVVINRFQTINNSYLKVKDTCSTVTEEEVINQAFELIMAFDELISMGYREKLELDQLHTILEMESHEENLQNLIRQVCFMCFC
jgi:hypothetical protein